MTAIPGTKRITIATALASLSLLVVAVLAVAADRTDPSFGRDGVAQPPPPAGTAAADLGIRDLVSTGHGGLVAAVGDFGRRGYFAAAKLSPSGALNRSFGEGGYTPRLHIHHGPGLRLRARAVAVQGKRVLVAGYQETELGGTAPLLARYRPDGALDPSFGHRGVVAPKPAIEGKTPSDPNYNVRGGGAFYGVAVQPGGRIIAVGARNAEGGGQPAALVVGYRPDGRLDPSFAEGGRLVIPRRWENLFTGFTSVKVRPDRNILVAGYIHGALAVLRLTADGRPDPSFGDDGVVTPAAGQPRDCCATPVLLGLTKKERILLGGISDRAREDPLLLFRLHADGSTDRSFGTKGHIFGHPPKGVTVNFIPHALAVQGDGRIVVAGIDEHEERDGRLWPVFTVLRYLPRGKVDRSFGRDGVETLPSSQAGAAVAATTTASSVVVGGGSYPRHTMGALFSPILIRYPQGH